MIVLALLSAAAAGLAVLAAMPRTGPGVPELRLMTRSGQPARADEVVAASLMHMHGYMALGTPSELVRERVLSPELAERVGKEGRVLVAEVLDYAHEVMAYPRPPQRSRLHLFEAVERLNAWLERQGLGYHVHAQFEWDQSYRRIDQVVIEPLAITSVRAYRAGERTVRVLRVERLGAPRLGKRDLGFASPDFRDVVVMPVAIEHELERGLWPARDPGQPTEYFPVADADRGTDWYRRLRQAMATAMREELATSFSDSRDGLKEALFASVELHEIQHQLDFAARWPLREPFRELGLLLGHERQGRWCMYETSAHLAQLARAATPRTILGQITSYAFRSACTDIDCLAALAILDALSVELEPTPPLPLLARRSYSLAAVADRYTQLAAQPSAAVRDAARRAWEQMFEAPLPDMQRLARPEAEGVLVYRPPVWKSVGQ